MKEDVTNLTDACHQPVKPSFADQASFLCLQQNFKATGWRSAMRVTQTTMMTFLGVQHPTLVPLSLHRPHPVTKMKKDRKGESCVISPFKAPWASQECNISPNFP